MIWLLFVGCLKTYTLNGQVRDMNGKPIKNAIVKVDVAEVETRTDKKGKFSLDIKYNKKKAPYILEVMPLSHKLYQQELEFGKNLQLKTKLNLKPKSFYLPYSKSSIDLENPEVLNAPENTETTAPQKGEETKATEEKK